MDQLCPSILRKFMDNHSFFERVEKLCHVNVVERWNELNCTGQTKTVVWDRIGYDRKILIKTFEIYLVLSCLLLIVHLKLLLLHIKLRFFDSSVLSNLSILKIQLNLVSSLLCLKLSFYKSSFSVLLNSLTLFLPLQSFTLLLSLFFFSFLLSI